MLWMWGLAPDYQMLQADGRGEERTRLMVALIGLQKAPKPENRKKESFPDCSRYQINRAMEAQHTPQRVREVSPRIILVVKY